MYCSGGKLEKDLQLKNITNDSKVKKGNHMKPTFKYDSINPFDHHIVAGLCTRLTALLPLISLMLNILVVLN